MAKNLIKEMIISLLLCLAIILLLGILLYDYVPMTKTIPNPVSYKTPDNVKQELAQTTAIDEEQVIMTYEVDSADLNNYTRVQNYKPGKANPFSTYETVVEKNGNNTANTATTNSNSIAGNTTNTTSGSSTTSTNDSNNSASSTNTSGNTSGGQFFQDKGTK